MADPTQQLLDIFRALTQPLPGDLTGQQLVLRGLTLDAQPTMVVDTAEQVLSPGQDLELLTTITGPWRPTVVAIKFLVDDGMGNLVPNQDPKTVGLYLVIEGEDYPLVEMTNWTGTAVSITDVAKLGAGDQVKIVARCNTGTAKAVVRGEVL